MIEGPVLIFATRSYEALKKRIAGCGHLEEGRLHRELFPDGEHYLRIETPLAGREVALVGGTLSDAETLELYDLACGMVAEGALRLTLLVPYFGYSTMERAIKPGEVVTAKNRARLLSSIPAPREGIRVVMVDLHSEGLPHYFEGAMRTLHLYARPIVLEQARKLGGDHFVLACTDAGRAKWVESLANDLGVTASFVFKRRLSGDRTQITAVSAQVQDQTVVIYDDMIRTGGSLIQAAEAYRSAGAASIYAIATHGVLPGDALNRILDTGLFNAIVCTDTHPRVLALSEPRFSVVSVAPLLAELLLRDR